MGYRTTRPTSGGRAAALRLVACFVVAAVVIGAVAVPAAGAAAGQDDTTFVVSLAEDGSAEVTLVLAFDLGSDADRQALDRLRENRSAIVGEFREGLAGVAARTAAETGREMQITDAAARISTDGSTGTVELSATWVGLAAVEGDRLVVEEPFADGFEPPGRFVIRAPDGYERASSTPEPATESGASVAWGAGTSLDGFAATFAPADAADGGIPSQSLPGFGFPAAIVAVALVAVLSVFGARERS